MQSQRRREITDFTDSTDEEKKGTWVEARSQKARNDRFSWYVVSSATTREGDHRLPIAAQPQPIGKEDSEKRRLITDFTDCTDEERKGVPVEARKHTARIGTFFS
jgi:hypothetical protein